MYDQTQFCLEFPAFVDRGSFELILDSVHAADGVVYRVRLDFFVSCAPAPTGACTVTNVAYAQERTN